MLPKQVVAGSSPVSRSNLLILRGVNTAWRLLLAAAPPPRAFALDEECAHHRGQPPSDLANGSGDGLALHDGLPRATALHLRGGEP